MKVPTGVKRMNMAYSRHHSIGKILSILQFDRLKGPKVSSYGFHNQIQTMNSIVTPTIQQLKQVLENYTVLFVIYL